MFGLKKEVIAALLALALLILLGAGLYIRHVFNERAELELRVAQQASAIKGHEQVEAELRQADADKEAAYARNARDKAALAAQLRDSRAQFQAMVAISPEVRAWANTGLPGDVAARLRARTRERGAAGHQGDTAERAAAGDAAP